jgi:hypothetical protein
MVAVDLTMRTSATAILLITVGLLSGCASPGSSPAASPGESYPDISLAKSKSNVQLLRNSAESRIPEEVILSRVEADSSVACLSAAEDPDGKIRHWLSTTEVNLVQWHAWRVDDVAQVMIDTFVDQSWHTIDVKGEYSSAATLLTSAKGLAKIQIETVGTEDDSAATIHISVSGPCVKTDGATSDEVSSLEKK